MTVPQISNVYPNQGPAGGWTMVRILGLDFTDPVQVSFGSNVAEFGYTANSALLYWRSPISPLSDSETGSGAGSVDVMVQNLDSNGDPIPGEVATFVDGFEYVRPSLAKEGTLLRVVRAFMTELRRQIISNVVIRRGLDYADTAGIAAGKISISSLPAIVLVGPTFSSNRNDSSNVQPTVQGERYLVKRRAGATGDLQFVLVGATDKTWPGLNLEEAVIAFFTKNTKITIPRDPNDLSLGYISYEMAFVPASYPVIADSPNDSGVVYFTGTVSIIEYTVEGFTTTDTLAESEMVLDLVGPEPEDGVELLVELFVP